MKFLTNLLLACMLFFSGVVFAQKEFTRTYQNVSLMKDGYTTPSVLQSFSTITFNYGDDYYIRIQSLNKDILLEMLGDSIFKSDKDGDRYQEIFVRDVKGKYHTIKLFTDTDLGVMLISTNPRSVIGFF